MWGGGGGDAGDQSHIDIIASYRLIQTSSWCSPFPSSPSLPRSDSLCLHSSAKGSKELTLPSQQGEHLTGVGGIATRGPMLVSGTEILILQWIPTNITISCWIMTENCWVKLSLCMAISKICMNSDYCRHKYGKGRQFTSIKGVGLDSILWSRFYSMV